jgi:hypothetical protein
MTNAALFGLYRIAKTEPQIGKYNGRIKGKNCSTRSRKGLTPKRYPNLLRTSMSTREKEGT